MHRHPLIRWTFPEVLLYSEWTIWYISILALSGHIGSHYFRTEQQVKELCGNTGEWGVSTTYPVSNVATAVGHWRAAVAASASILPAARAWAAMAWARARAGPAVVATGAPVRTGSTDRVEEQISFEIGQWFSNTTQNHNILIQWDFT